MQGVSTVMARYGDYRAWCWKQGVKKRSRVLLSFEGYCAILIQHWWRRITNAQTSPPASLVSAHAWSARVCVTMHHEMPPLARNQLPLSGALVLGQRLQQPLLFSGHGGATV